MKCPSCNETLAMTERLGIEIDYCPQCRGVWLDRGELDKIIEKSVDQVTGAQNPIQQNPNYNEGHYGDHHKSKHGYGKHGRRGFLGNLFDF